MSKFTGKFEGGYFSEGKIKSNVYFSSHKLIQDAHLNRQVWSKIIANQTLILFTFSDLETFVQ